jgi:hypothetical protein
MRNIVDPAAPAAAGHVPAGPGVAGQLVTTLVVIGLVVIASWLLVRCFRARRKLRPGRRVVITGGARDGARAMVVAHDRRAGEVTVRIGPDVVTISDRRCRPC